MLKIKQNSKKKAVVKPAHTEAQTKKASSKPRPEWNDNSNDMNQYKLSQAELIQKKVSLMSKNRTEARDLWLKRQEKLKKGVLDEETQIILETCSKKPPEKNLKNNTYFIRAEHSDLRSPTDGNKSEVTDTTLSLQTKEEEGELINKIDRDLKETRDFIQKFDKYSHVTKSDIDPARLLSVHQNIKSKNYETNAEQVVRRPPPSKQKNSAKKIGSKNSENQNSNSKKPSQEYEADGENDVNDSFEKLKKIAHKDGDIACYFSSLNKIEDTIKFLEQNIIGAEQKQKENKKEDQGMKDSFGHQQSNVATRKPFEPIDINKFFEGSPVRREPSQQSGKKMNVPGGLLSEGKVHFDLENFEPNPKSKIFESENRGAVDNNNEEDQISFSLTMRSGDFDQENENRRVPTERTSVGMQTGRPSAVNEASYRVENHHSSKIDFDQIVITKEQPKGTKDKNNLKTTEECDNENDNKENEFFYDENEEIERIKQMLKATQEDIQKMTSVVFEFPGQTIKRTQGAIQNSVVSSDKTNVIVCNEPMRGLVSNPSQSSFYAESSLERNPLKEPTLSVKPQQLSNLLRNVEKLPLQDITSQFSGGEEEVPKPLAIRSRPTPMSHPNHERNSLSIRANLR